MKGAYSRSSPALHVVIHPRRFAPLANQPLNEIWRAAAEKLFDSLLAREGYLRVSSIWEQQVHTRSGDLRFIVGWAIDEMLEEMARLLEDRGGQEGFLELVTIAPPQPATGEPSR